MLFARAVGLGAKYYAVARLGNSGSVSYVVFHYKKRKFGNDYDKIMESNKKLLDCLKKLECFDDMIEEYVDVVEPLIKAKSKKNCAIEFIREIRKKLGIKVSYEVPKEPVYIDEYSVHRVLMDVLKQYNGLTVGEIVWLIYYRGVHVNDVWMDNYLWKLYKEGVVDYYEDDGEIFWVLKR